MVPVPWQSSLYILQAFEFLTSCLTDLFSVPFLCFLLGHQLGDQGIFSSFLCVPLIVWILFVCVTHSWCSSNQGVCLHFANTLFYPQRWARAKAFLCYLGQKIREVGGQQESELASSLNRLSEQPIPLLHSRLLNPTINFLFFEAWHNFCLSCQWQHWHSASLITTQQAAEMWTAWFFPDAFSMLEWMRWLSRRSVWPALRAKLT